MHNEKKNILNFWFFSKVLDFEIRIIFPENANLLHFLMALWFYARRNTNPFQDFYKKFLDHFFTFVFIIYLWEILKRALKMKYSNKVLYPGAFLIEEKIEIKWKILPVMLCRRFWRIQNCLCFYSTTKIWISYFFLE